MIMAIEEAGITSNACRSRLGSPPAMTPIIRELTASPSQPLATTMPSAVDAIRGNVLPTMAIVVGNTGAIETPARKTSIPATDGLCVCNIENVVIAMATAAASKTQRGRTWIRTGETATRPANSPSANPSDRIFRARDCGMPSCRQVPREPVPHSDFARHVKEQEQRQEKQNGPAEKARNFEFLPAQASAWHVNGACRREFVSMRARWGGPPLRAGRPRPALHVSMCRRFQADPRGRGRPPHSVPSTLTFRLRHATSSSRLATGLLHFSKLTDQSRQGGRRIVAAPHSNEIRIGRHPGNIPVYAAPHAQVAAERFRHQGHTQLS